MNILYAEDHEATREAFAALLRQRGHTVDAVGNGQQLLEKIRANKYQMVFTDNDMPPGMTGVEALRHIRRNEVLKNMPVIVFTGRQEAKEAVEKYGGIFLNKSAPIIDVFDFIEKAGGGATPV